MVCLDFPSGANNSARYLDVVYCCKYPENDCNDFYIGETDRLISKIIIDHDKGDKNSHPFQYAQNKKHAHVWVNDLTILNSNYRSTIRKKISESLHILDKRSRHQIQKRPE